MAFLFASFDANKLRLKLKVANTRIELLKNKKVVELKQQKKEVANLLKGNRQIELARIRTEHIVREDWQVEVIEILGLLCSLVQERTKLLEVSTKIPFDMQESCATICYAADRIEYIPELSDIKQQLMLKFKKELTEMLATEVAAREHVNARVFLKLSVQPPNAFTVTQYMKAIAEEYEVDWVPEGENARLDAPVKAPVGSTVVSGAASNIRTPYYITDGTIAPSSSPGGLRPGNVPQPPPASSRPPIPPSTATTTSGVAGNAFVPPPAAPNTMPSDFVVLHGGDEDAPRDDARGGAHHLDNDDDEDAEARAFAARFGNLSTEGGDGHPARTPGVEGTSGKPIDAAIPDFEELSRRFEQLKKKS